MPNTDAIKALSNLLGENFEPKRLDQTHDVLRLIGLVLGQMTLLEVVTDSRAKAADRVAAARLLLATDESPETIAERLRQSVFSGLSVDELGTMIDKVRKGETNVSGMIEQLKQ